MTTSIHLNTTSLTIMVDCHSVHHEIVNLIAHYLKSVSSLTRIARWIVYVPCDILDVIKIMRK